MIVRMSKVEIIGSRDRLDAVLTVIEEKGDLHIDPSNIGFIDLEDTAEIRTLLPDDRTLFEKMFLEELNDKIHLLFALLPEVEVRQSPLSPGPIIDTIRRTVDRHLAWCREQHHKKEGLLHDLVALEGQLAFLRAVSSLMEGMTETPDLDLIGLTLEGPEVLPELRQQLENLTNGLYELATTRTEEGRMVGLLAVEKSRTAAVGAVLRDTRLPEYTFPESFRNLPLDRKQAYLADTAAERRRDLATVDRDLERFARRWGPIYNAADHWLAERLTIIRAEGQVFESRMCFFIYGWMPTRGVEPLRGALEGRFTGGVHLQELEIRREDLERIPVALRNPAYFKPFEQLTRLLPLPRYGSYDPTPFIGIFFPLFFGLILGDAGYGLLLLPLAAWLVFKYGDRPLLGDGGRILGACALYTIIFGLLYGEILGDLGSRLLGLHPLLFERQDNIMAMLVFALSIGFVHVTLGLTLGLIAAIRHRLKKEALAIFLNLVLLTAIGLLLIMFFGVFPDLLARPLIILILTLTPLLLFSGGLLAPLELLKTIGNIVSYARIMAIGLTSVLLALVANMLSGLTGDIVLGAVVGILIHLINIVIGVFASAIHSLRLHYVEFFSKFVETGGRPFQPLHRRDPDRLAKGRHPIG